MSIENELMNKGYFIKHRTLILNAGEKKEYKEGEYKITIRYKTSIIEPPEVFVENNKWETNLHGKLNCLCSSKLIDIASPKYVLTYLQPKNKHSEIEVPKEILLDINKALFTSLKKEKEESKKLQKKFFNIKD